MGSRVPSNVGGLADDTAGFDRIFWQRLCQKYLYCSNNTYAKEFIVEVSGVRRDVNDEDGLGVFGYEESFIIKRLKEIESKGLIQFLDSKRYSLTQDGIRYCKSQPVTYG